MRMALGMLVVSLFAGIPTAAGDPPVDEMAIAGTWVIESAKDDGKDEATLKDARITFKDGKVELKTGDGEKLTGTYKIDPSAKPKAVDITLKVGDFPITKKGLYSLDKDRLTICLAIDRDAERPGKQDGVKCSLWKLKRAK
jgi:uncharacterized protein (TIGR03067 family)